MMSLESVDSFQPQKFSGEPASRIPDEWLRLYDATSDSPVIDASALRAAIAVYARSLRDEGMPPERAVIALKDTLYRHGGHASFTSLYEEATPRNVANAPSRYARVFEWFLDAYFDRGASQG